MLETNVGKCGFPFQPLANKNLVGKQPFESKQNCDKVDRVQGGGWWGQA